MEILEVIALRVVVFSDTHGNGLAVKKIMEKNKDVQHFIFLGDGNREIRWAVGEYPDKEFHIVAGNCDIASKFPKIAFLELGGHKILYTHGDTLGVGFTLSKIENFALYNNADIVCFGHLHARINHYENGLHLVNPSSASCPRDGKKPAYAFIDIEPGGVFVSHVDL